MLLYNDKYEFTGINEEGLRLLNYATLEDLLDVCSDVADLFANEPGYIHNFKNFKWIDFLLHAESDAKNAIVHAKGRTFSCQLSVTPFFLSSNPSQSGYAIEMLQIKSISGEEFKPQASAPKSSSDFTPSPTISLRDPAPLPDYTHITPTQLSEPTVFDIPDIEPSGIDDLIDLMPLTQSKTEEKAPVAAAPIELTSGDKEYLSNLKTDRSYHFDPQVAANELGLPVDLIEEFIGDFIQQAYTFKDDLFSATLKSDFNNLHILSHKLKGVAANLRVEDALETLTIINASTDIPEIEANLKHFYSIIAKLEGKEVISEPETPTLSNPEAIVDHAPVVNLSDDDDIYSFGLKQHDDEPITVEETFFQEKELLSPDDVFKNEEVPAAVAEESFHLDELLPEPNLEMIKPYSANRVILHYDVEEMAQTLGIEAGFLHELLNEFKRDARTVSETILEAIAAFDTHTWRDHAGRFIGISDNLRLSEISEEFSIIASTSDAQKAKQASLRLNGYLDQLH